MSSTNLVPLRYCDYMKSLKELRVSSEFFGAYFPKEVNVLSHHTNKIVKFVMNEAVAIQNEFWDGEYMQYVPTEEIKNVKTLIVYHTC